MPSWHEDDEFWETFGPYMFDEKRIEGGPEMVASLLELVEVEPDASVLDLCCGPGRHSLEFARRGFRVTGVDRTAGYLEQAREAAAAESLEIEFVRDDMRTFVRPGAFDLAINLYTSFGYFEREQNVRVVKNLRESLRPNGWVVLEMAGREVIARKFQPRRWHDHEDGSIMLEEALPSGDWSYMENRWILIRDGERKEFRMRFPLLTAEGLKQMLAEGGFGNVSVYGALDGRPYDQEALRLVAVAQP